MQTDLSGYILDEFVHGEGDVGVNGEHLSQGILILRRLHIPIQQVTHHLQKRRVIILHIHIHWNRKTWKYELNSHTAIEKRDTFYLLVKSWSKNVWNVQYFLYVLFIGINSYVLNVQF